MFYQGFTCFQHTSCQKRIVNLFSGCVFVFSSVFSLWFIQKWTHRRISFYCVSSLCARIANVDACNRYNINTHIMCCLTIGIDIAHTNAVDGIALVANITGKSNEIEVKNHHFGWRCSLQPGISMASRWLTTDHIRIIISAVPGQDGGKCQQCDRSGMKNADVGDARRAGERRELDLYTSIEAYM